MQECISIFALSSHKGFSHVMISVFIFSMLTVHELNRKWTGLFCASIIFQNTEHIPFKFGI